MCVLFVYMCVCFGCLLCVRVKYLTCECVCVCCLCMCVCVLGVCVSVCEFLVLFVLNSHS